MLHYDRIDLHGGIDPGNINNGKECIVCHNWYSNHGFKFQYSVCNGFNDLTMMCVSLSNIAIKTLWC